MRTIVAFMRRRTFLFIAPFILVFVIVLSACGSNTPVGNGPGTAASPTATAPTNTSPGTPEGCPNTTTVNAAPAAANVVLTQAKSGTEVNAKKGDTIEIDLPFGHIWEGPGNAAQGMLTAQGPAGYAWQSGKVCVWRFVATATGTAHLSYLGRPICKKDEACPLYVMSVPFTITIQ